MTLPASSAPPATTAAPSTRPRSAVSTGVGIAGLVGLIGWFFIARHFRMDGELSALTSVFVCGLFMVLWSLLIDKVHRNSSTGIDWDHWQKDRNRASLIKWLALGGAVYLIPVIYKPLLVMSLYLSATPWAGVVVGLWLAPIPYFYVFGYDRPRTVMKVFSDTALTKIASLWATWALIAAAYVILRFYWQGQYGFSMKWLGIAIVPMLLLSIPYVLWLDRRLIEPRDSAWHFGRWLLGADDADRAMIWKHWRAWIVKAFFLAFMLSIVPGNFLPILLRPWEVIVGNPVEFALFGIAALYLVDVHFATVGYILTMRPLDAHIRTANPYGMAWVAALACYPPFVLMNPGGPLFYQDGARDWSVWLDHFAAHPALFWIWGSLLIGLNAIYAWATVAFGIRFSNLTHRGIITHGPYRFTRHPAYVAKNAFWWLSSLVILPWDESYLTAIRNTALLCAVSGIYYWRAKTEEKHLLADPAYRAYWNWAQENALIPRLCSRFTGLAKPVIALEPDPRVGPVA